MSAPLLLAGDVGGTKTKLALFSYEGGSLKRLRCERYPSATAPSLGSIVREFLGTDRPAIAAAGFGVPGPVHGGRAKPTNLSWGVDAAELSAEFHIPYVAVLNDLAANAEGIACLQPEDFATIQAGDPQASGNRCVVSPGTGLGEAGLFWDGRRHRVWACEGGHCDFAPRNELETALLEYLQKQFGHVSAERIISGLGITNIYKFLRDTGRAKENPAAAAEMHHSDPNVVISKYADLGSCELCVRTLEVFVGCLAAEAGNMALKAMATGGVFLGGGIPAKMLARLQGVGFIHAFTDKGRLTSLMESMPVRVILNDDAALLGAAQSGLNDMLAHA